MSEIKTISPQNIEQKYREEYPFIIFEGGKKEKQNDIMKQIIVTQRASFHEGCDWVIDDYYTPLLTAYTAQTKQLDEARELLKEVMNKVAGFEDMPAELENKIKAYLNK